MYLLFPILLSLVFLEMGQGSARAYQLLYQYKKSQIAMDNTLIVLGQKDRALFQQIEDFNQKMEKLHHKHHHYHRCAQVPKTAPFCKPLDLQAETRLLLDQRRIQFMAMQAWIANRQTAQKEFSSLKVTPSKFERALSVPLVPRPCRACAFYQGWKIDFEKAGALARVFSTQASGGIEWRQNAFRKPQYRFTQ